MKIRECLESDLIKIVDICNESLLEQIELSGGDPTLISVEFLKSTLDKTNILVTEINSKVVGYLQYQIDENDLIINGAAVTEAEQKKGIATKMFFNVTEEAHAKGCKTVVISVQPTNKEIWNIYRRFGFKHRDSDDEWNQALEMDLNKIIGLISNRMS